MFLHRHVPHPSCANASWRSWRRPHTLHRVCRHGSPACQRLTRPSGSQPAARDRDRDRDREGFRALWCRLKPADKPEAGIPFDTEDAMFSPPVTTGTQQRPLSQYSLETPTFAQQGFRELSPTPPPSMERTPVCHRLLPSHISLLTEPSNPNAVSELFPWKKICGDFSKSAKLPEETPSCCLKH